MKILVICQYYYPEPFRIKDICEEMVRLGHEVMVVTGIPNYPEGVIYKGYEKGKKREEVINGVRVHRCFTIPRKSGMIYRFLNYFSYAFTSAHFVKTKKCRPSVGEAFDIIFVNQLSPVMMGYAAMKYKNKYKVPAILYCLDLWPESLAAGGIKKNSFIYKIFHIISKKIYRNMDRILVTSRMFSEHLEAEFGIPKNMTEYLPQYAEDLFKVNSQTTNKSVCDLVFAGNIGRVQSIDTILEAAGLLRDKPINWHIIGSGTDLERLKNVAENTALDKVFFYGRRPVEEMPEFYAMADAMLVTMSADPVLSLTLPGKVQSYMAAGKPIIAAANGETAEIVANACCGFCGPAEDGVALAENVIRFLKSNDKAKFGYNARKFYDNNFAQNNFIKRFEDELTAVGTGQ